MVTEDKRFVPVEVGVEEQPPEDIVSEGIREVNGEDLSDLFNVSYEDVMGDTEEGLAELTDVTEEDVFGEGGEDMSDLVDVPEEDLEGLDGFDYAPEPKPVPVARPVPQFRVNPNVRRLLPQQPPSTTVGGLK